MKAAKQIMKTCYQKLDGKMPVHWNARAISRFKRGVAICEDTVNAADKVSYQCFWAVKHKQTPAGHPFVQRDVKPLEMDVEGIQYTLIQNLKNLRNKEPLVRHLYLILDRLFALLTRHNQSQKGGEWWFVRGHRKEVGGGTNFCLLSPQSSQHL